VTGPKVSQRADGTTAFVYSRLPSPFQFYFRILTSKNNFLKSSRLKEGKKIPPFEVIVEDGRLESKALRKFLKICGLSASRYTKEQPFTWNFASILPLASCVITHPKFPIRPITTLIHIRQTIDQLRALEVDERIKKRLVLGGGRTTDRGSEIEGRIELYTNENQLTAAGTSVLLIPGKRAAKKEEEQKKDELPITKTQTFPVKGSTGLEYASASGDYNPWHLTPFLARLFGFKKPIAQGYWSVTRCIGELGDEIPPYPLHFEVEWIKPLFMPSTVKFTTRKRADGNKINFELSTEDGQHVHLIGSVEHVPDLKLTKTETIA
jgi:acyl dehydratase